MRTLTVAFVAALASVAPGFEVNPAYPWSVRNNTIRVRRWGSPVDIPAMDPIAGVEALANVQGAVHFSMMYNSTTGHAFPSQLRIHERTGAITGTPLADCVGFCQQNFTIRVFASDDASTNVLVERFKLVLDSRVVNGTGGSSGGGGGGGNEDDDDGSFPMMIAVAVVAVMLAITVLLTICYLVKRKQVRQMQAAGGMPGVPMTPKSLKNSPKFDAPFDGRSPDKDQSESPTRHVDITDVPADADADVDGIHIQNGQYLDILASSVNEREVNESVDETQPWYAGGMRRTQCEQEVASAEHGDFLVRKSRGSDMFVLTVNDSGTATSFPITRITDEDNIDKYVFGAKLFDNLRGLIKYLRINPLTGKDGSHLQLQSAAAIINDEIMSTSMLSDISASSSVSMAAGSDWFAGAASRSVVEASVVRSGQGDYLVRESRKGTNYVLCLNDSGAPLSFQIQREGAAFIFTGRAFRSMTSLIEFLRSTPLMGQAGNPVILGMPAPLLASTPAGSRFSSTPAGSR